MTKFSPLKDFSDVAKKYLAPIEALESVEQVNNWCNNKTHGKIDKNIRFSKSTTIMIILNAVYFKGEWNSKFDSYSTKKLPFYNFGTEEIEIANKSQIDHFQYYEH